MIPRPPETVEDRLFELIEQTWAEAGAWPEFISAMRQSLSARPAVRGSAETARPAWLRLPLLCCQAAGGDPRLAEPAAACWGLLYAAAHLLDHVQDGDAPDAWWEALGAGPALNAATGLIVTSALLLAARNHPEGAGVLAGIQLRDIFQTVLHMASGQHLDLTAPSLSLQQVWRVAEAKSGAFFGLACRAGARAAGIDESLVSHYSTYGVSLGLLIQIGDDLTDLADSRGEPSGRSRMALPLAYHMSVAPLGAIQELHGASSIPGASGLAYGELAELLDASGAGLYLTAKVHEYRRRGASALRRAAEPSPAVEHLLELLESTPPPV